MAGVDVDLLYAWGLRAVSADFDSVQREDGIGG